MLDWFTGYVGYDASQMRLGEFYEVDSGGAFVRRRARWETAVGSYESGLQVTRGSVPEAGRDSLGMIGAAAKFGYLCANPAAVLKLSGNPAKFLQGHNAAGPSVTLLGPVLQAVARSLGEGLRPIDADSDVLPSVHRSRVDVTTACDLGTHDAVHALLYHLQKCGRSRQGRAADAATSAYFQKNSRRWTLKFYCKHCELRDRPPKIAPELLAELLEWTRTQVRVELTLRRPELIHRGTLNESVIWDFVSRLEVSAMAPKVAPMQSLPPSVRAALALWYAGHDITSDALYTRPTRYRYRRKILDATGIDVFLPRADQSESGQPTLVSLDELRAREVGAPPERIQRSLWGAQ